MVWESVLSGSTQSQSLLFVLANLKVDKDNVILVYGNGFLNAVSSIDGEVLWKKELTADGIDIKQLIYPTGSDIIYAVGFSESSQFGAYQINARNGELLKHEMAEFSGGFSGKLSSVSSDTFVATDASQSALVLISITDGGIIFKQTSISDLVQDFSGTVVVLPSKLTGTFSVRLDASVVFIKVADGGKLHVVDKVDKEAAVSDALFLSEGEEAFAFVEPKDSKIQLTVKYGDWSKKLLKDSIEIDNQRVLVRKVFINNYTRTDRSLGFRALIVMEDHSLLLAQQGAVVWSREDGLASVVDVAKSELPVEKHGVSVAKVEQNLFEWLKVFSAFSELNWEMVWGACKSSNITVQLFSEKCSRLSKPVKAASKACHVVR